MFALTLALVLAQSGAPAAADVGPGSTALAPLTGEPTPQEGLPGGAVKEAPRPPSPASRVVYSSAAGVAGGLAGLGIALALTGQNPAFDVAFANVMLAPLLISGLGFAVHQAMQGGGEVVLAYLASLAVMAAAAGITMAIDVNPSYKPAVATAIGAVPAAFGAALVLELTTRKTPRSPQFALSPTGFSGVF